MCVPTKKWRKFCQEGASSKPESKIWLQSVPVEHKLVSNRQWFIMLVKFLNFRYASSWILCLYGSRGQISDCSIKLYWIQTVTYFYMLYIYRVRQDDLDIYTICKQECPHHLVSYSIIKLESTSLARKSKYKVFFLLIFLWTKET